MPTKTKKNPPPAYCISTDIETEDGTLDVISNFHSSFTRCPKCDNLIKVDKGIIRCDDDDCDFNVTFCEDIEAQLKKDVKANWKAGVR